MLKSQSEKLEKHRKEVFDSGGGEIFQIPPHFSLQKGMAHTVKALFFYRTDEEGMRSVYFLAGLMDCMINQINPILRTDLLRDLYKKVFDLKKQLRVNWYGPLDHLLLPIDMAFFSEPEYRVQVNDALTLKELYQTIRRGTDEMFDILSLEYVFYVPTTGVNNGTG
jgi:hypothetical protein